MNMDNIVTNGTLQCDNNICILNMCTIFPIFIQFDLDLYAFLKS